MPCAHKHIYNSTSADMKSTTVTLAMNCIIFFIVDLATKYGVIIKMGVVIVCVFFSLLKLG